MLCLYELEGLCTYNPYNETYLVQPVISAQKEIYCVAG